MLLVLETSSPCASLALFREDGGDCFWKSDFITERSHNSKIFGHIETALKQCDGKLRAILVGTGPGSYSGIRVAIAAANGLSISMGIPAFGRSSLEAYAEGRRNYHVVGDARRNTWFLARIEEQKLMAEPELLGEPEFRERLPDISGPIFTMDAAVAECFEGIEHRYPGAEWLGSTWHIPETENECPLEPCYLRPPYITKAKKKPVPGFPGRSG